MSILGWSEENNQLVKEFIFENFAVAIEFIDQVAARAEAANHHPDIFLHDYKQVRISLTSHETGGITEQDRGLAAAIDQISKKPGD